MKDACFLKGTPNSHSIADMRSDTVHPLPFKEDLPLAGGHLAGDQLKQCRLALTDRADPAGNEMGFQREGTPGDGANTAIPFFKILNFQQRSTHRSSPPSKGETL